MGLGDTGDRQLFEYAFHLGVPLAVLTDGQEWSFFLPGEEGRLEERRVYKLDILERAPEDAADRLTRYLQYQRVISGDALSAARKDLRNVARDRLISSTLPKAWYDPINEPDELLLELLAEKVEDICGYRPDLDMCSEYILAGKLAEPVERVEVDAPPVPSRRKGRQTSTGAGTPTPSRAGFTLGGSFYVARSARDVMQQILTMFAEKDSTFLDRFAARKHGRKRRFIARTTDELSPGRPDLGRDHSVQLVQGWWLFTNWSKRSIERIIRLACEVAGVDFGTELTVSL